MHRWTQNIWTVETTGMFHGVQVLPACRCLALGYFKKDEDGYVNVSGNKWKNRK